MAEEAFNAGKKNVTISLTHREIDDLKQLDAKTGLGKSRVIGKMITDYYDSFLRKNS